VNVSYYIPYSFKRQDAAVTWTTFYGVAGLKSLANHQIRLYHSHKVWCRVQMRAWLSVVRFRSGLLTILLVSLVWCIKVDTLETSYEEDLDWTHYHFIYFYITNKLHFYILVSFWYPHFLLFPTNPLACNWELSPPFLFACHSKYLFCPFQWFLRYWWFNKQYYVSWLGKTSKSFLFSFSFSFSFSFFILDLLLQGWSMGRHHVTQSQSQSQHVMR